ncbi:MAG: SDR family oxidoreductase [Ardenticatenaceae bacterium]|nr:SDR family oxidoreductase [Anaerolineales bacterium]MCB8938317.1 SDR family oxidoreductase [Ardenticatenaceae bacterium]MCB8975376.1 SDR family oxidoreductase [Ardenticatenaceae bacterium]
MNLKQTVGIVTGAGQGVGAQIAHTLAAAGVCVAVNDINPDRAERTAVAIREAGGEAIAIAADVANKFQCVHLVETTRAQWGRLDILVNNAAIMPQSTILKLDEWEWNRCLEVNLKGTFFMSQLVGRVMTDENQERGGGVIINIASTAGVELPLENRAAYCASKAGVVGFSRECAREYAPYGIRIHTLVVAEERPSAPSNIAQTILTLCQHPNKNLLHRLE